jgi:hypothetical protein
MHHAWNRAHRSDVQISIDIGLSENKEINDWARSSPFFISPAHVISPEGAHKPRTQLKKTAFPTIAKRIREQLCKKEAAEFQNRRRKTRKCATGVTYHPREPPRAAKSFYLVCEWKQYTQKRRNNKLSASPRPREASRIRAGTSTNRPRCAPRTANRTTKFAYFGVGLRGMRSEIK